MNNEPKVSIVIPCFNDGIYIKDAVDSALNQTFKDFEIIIVDDGSNIETHNVLKTIVHSKVKLIVQENKGLSAARNIGFEKAKGVYVLTLDADDVFEPSFLEKAVVVLDSYKDVGFVSCFVNSFTELNKPFYKNEPKGGNIENFLFRNNAVGNSLYRKKCWELVGGYDEAMKKGYEDWEFHVAITKRGWRSYIIKEYLFNYRNKPNSMLKISNKNYEEENVKYVFNKHKDIYSINYEKVVDYLLGIALRHKHNEIKRINSIDFKIGRLVLKPLRLFKKLFK